MSFIIDKQTLDDLSVFGHRQDRSIYGIYNLTHTRGGARIMEEMFLNPLDDCRQIERRAALIDYFRRHDVDFPFEGGWFDAAEFYLSNTDSRTRLEADDASLNKRFQRMMRNDSEYETIHNGLVALVSVIVSLDRLTAALAADAELMRLSAESVNDMRSVLGAAYMDEVRAAAGVRKLPPQTAARLDSLLRYERAGEVRRMLDFIYMTDVYTTAARVASERGFVRAEVLPAEANMLVAMREKASVTATVASYASLTLVPRNSSSKMITIFGWRLTHCATIFNRRTSA